MGGAEGRRRGRGKGGVNGMVERWSMWPAFVARAYLRKGTAGVR